MYELNKKREEGYDKGLVVAATGIGKTYLAAFDSRAYFYGDNKDATSDFIFATVQTLGKLEYLTDKYFKRDAFDYIVSKTICVHKLFVSLEGTNERSEFAKNKRNLYSFAEIFLYCVL